MTISDTDKIDFLWKKVIYGVTTTAGPALKSGSNENIPSPYAISPNSIWANAAVIPAFPPVSSTSDVVLYFGAQRIRCTNDNTSPPNITWIATSSYNDTTTRLTNFIPPVYGAGYVVEVFIGDPNSGTAARISPDTNKSFFHNHSWSSLHNLDLNTK